jgi:enamine deaminase RidA (YjgF/YER057c/UK114 family)
MTTTVPLSVNPDPWSLGLGYDQGQLRVGPTALLTVAAQGSVDEQGRLVHEGDVAAQLALCLVNLERVLATAGMTTLDLAQLRIYTTDLDQLRDVYDTLVEHLAETGARPPTTVVEVTRLPLRGLVVSLEALAVGTGPTGPSADRPEPTGSSLPGTGPVPRSTEGTQR